MKLENFIIVFVVFTVKCRCESIPVFNTGSFRKEMLKYAALKYVTVCLVFKKAWI